MKNSIKELIDNGHKTIVARTEEVEKKRVQYLEHADLFTYICSLIIISQYLDRVNKQEWCQRLSVYGEERITYTLEIMRKGEKIYFDVDDFVRKCRKEGVNLGEFDYSEMPSMLVTSMDHIRSRIKETGILKIDNDYPEEYLNTIIVSASIMELDNIFFAENYETKMHEADVATCPASFRSGYPLGKVYEKFKRTAPSDSLSGDEIK